jgi:hypothetical protein
MKQFSSQFKKQSESIRMRASERRELKEKLVSYMEYHPLPKEMKEVSSATSLIKGGITSEPFFALNFNTTYLRNFSGVFAVLCILAVPLVAENSLPGDVLYPVKVQFTEEVRSSLTFTPYAKVEWETQRLERRISEARLLASEGKLTPEIQTQFAEAIKVHADSAQRELALLKESDAEKAVIAEIAFASALAVQSEVLEGGNGSENQGGEGTAILAVADVVNEARSSVELAQGGVPVAYENILAAVESESTQVYELFSSVRGDASLEEIEDIERRLEDVKRKITDARGLHDGTPVVMDAEVVSVALLMNPVSEIEAISGDLATLAKVADPISAAGTVQSDDTIMMASTAVDAPLSDSAEIVVSETSKAEAVLLLTDALTDIQKLINYLTNIEVRESVSIETLVPVTPTAGERANEVKKVYDATKIIITDVDSRILSSKFKNKVRYGKEQVDERLTSVSQSMSAGNLDEAKRAVDEAHSFARDLQKMVANEPLKEVSTSTEIDEATPVVEESNESVAQ